MKIKSTIVGSLLWFCFSTVSQADDIKIESLRLKFQNWQTNFSSLDEEEQIKQLNALESYPLYPYAQYQYLNSKLETVSPQVINDFVQGNTDFPLKNKLIQNYLEQLTQQNDWQKLTQVNIDSSIASRCRYQYALLQQGQTQEALAPIKEIWLSGKDQPSACDPIFEEWGKTKEKSANLILLRIDLALQNKNIKLARYLTDQLPDNYKTIKKNLIALYDNPKKLSDFSKNIAATSFTRKIVINNFQRLVNTDADFAKKILPTLAKQQKLSDEEQISLQQMIASNYFKSTATAEQIKWRDKFIAKNGSTTLIERRIRLALKDNNAKDITYWLKVLPKPAQQKDEWRYWQAIELQKQNQLTKAKKILQQLVNERGFYAMFSAQKLGLPYEFDLAYSIVDTDPSQDEAIVLSAKYQDLPIIQRVKELHYWGMLSEANKEWNNLAYNSRENNAELARYAYYQGWSEQSIQATIAGQLWTNWVERFPVTYQTEFDNALEDKSINLSFALAIARQESALNPTVTSPVGARGLMQLIPATAKESAKKVDNISYSSTDQLYDPMTNIQLGTFYLDQVYQTFDNNRILAATAYNAGPNRAKRWLSESDGKLDPIAFIESIPFTETRNYVKNVLVYDYIYQLVLNKKPQGILTNNELAKKY